MRVSLLYPPVLLGHKPYLYVVVEDNDSLLRAVTTLEVMVLALGTDSHSCQDQFLNRV